MSSRTINDELLEAVAFHDAAHVLRCLEKGADPNYTTHTDEEEPNGIIQPTTPLRMVMFCISDALLTENDIRQLGEIARLLLERGADPQPAMQIAEYRYGKYNPHAEKSAFIDTWTIVAEAAKR